MHALIPESRPSLAAAETDPWPVSDQAGVPAEQHRSAEADSGHLSGTVCHSIRWTPPDPMDGHRIIAWVSEDLFSRPLPPNGTKEQLQLEGGTEGVKKKASHRYRTAVWEIRKGERERQELLELLLLVLLLHLVLNYHNTNDMILILLSLCC